MPSTSGRAATYPSRQDKLKFFHELKSLRDRLLLQKGRRNTEIPQATTYTNTETGTCTDGETATTCTNTETATCTDGETATTCTDIEISQSTST